MSGRPPEDTPRRDLAVSAILRFGLTILLCWLPFWKFGINATAAGLALLIFFPCSFMLAKPIMGIAVEFGDWFGRSHLAPWQGIYYNFANVQLRMFEVGPELWVVDADLLKVIGEKPSLMLESLYDAHEYDTIPGTRLRGFSPEGAQKVLMASDHFESKRALLWLQREVWKAHRRKRELAAGKR